SLAAATTRCAPPSASPADNKGITSESAYPYTAQDGTCQASGKPVAATITGFTDVPASSETALETAIVQQPVSVAVEAD
ncbi:hypothetical protein JG632_18875, partial [Vibrio cholerae]|nr:hypothetical protein [Vibrio cholerae]